ncbi:MAG TPA: peptidylprolyl isomerase, partial [Acidimicrobiia bacterium]|nr:peptidylprolyl isomerase [Acidimicrobiia bacterium]
WRLSPWRLRRIDPPPVEFVVPHLRFLLRYRPFPSVLLAVLVAACAGGAGGQVAATVNGTDITVADVQAMTIPAEESEETIDRTAFAADLTGAIIDLVVINAALEEFSIEPTDEEIDAKIAQLTDLITAAQDITLEDFLASQRLPESQFRVIAKQQVIRDKLNEQFRPDAFPASDADAELLRTAQGLGLVSACVSHILVPTEGEAETALDRIEGGEAFADVAAEVGTDGTAANGGELGCSALNRYVVEFGQAAADAEINEVTAPVESEFGWHLILVTERTGPPTNDELKEQITNDRINQLVDAWLLDTMEDAEVEVNAEYGSWVTAPVPQVVAPSG